MNYGCQHFVQFMAGEVQSEGILTPIDGVEEGEFITMLVMPVMLNSQFNGCWLVVGCWLMVVD